MFELEPILESTDSKSHLLNAKRTRTIERCGSTSARCIAQIVAISKHVNVPSLAPHRSNRLEQDGESALSRLYVCSVMHYTAIR
ncbi:hypothetical protein QE152_g879 [Popillia japonica]|uniref:Uncharacterized protein n=1 Tax=Popillia japonica TaxID=7064 RepID=A0AAW1NE46_POPJA